MHSEIKKLDAELERTVGHAHDELGGIRTNRPTPKLIEDIMVEHYGERMALKQLGSISMAPPNEIVINVWDKSIVSAVAKAIENAGRGLTVVVDAYDSIRVYLPPLNDERRVALIKLVKSMAEKERIKVRGFRDDANKKIKAMEQDEDMQFRLKEEVQKLIDKTNKQFDDMVAAKVREIED